MTPDLNGVTVSSYLSNELAGWLDAQDGSRSSNIATAVSLLRETMSGGELMERLAVSKLAEHIEAIAASFPGTRTSSGALWVSDPVHLPERLSDHAVISMPGMVVLTGSECQAVFLMTGGATVTLGSVEIETFELAKLACQLPQVVLQLNAAGVGSKAVLVAGLELHRTASGLEVSHEGTVISLDMATVLRWSAEVSAALAARATRFVGELNQLEAALAAPAAAAETLQ